MSPLAARRSPTAVGPPRGASPFPTAEESA
jgi:hypothetical protein